MPLNHLSNPIKSPLTLTPIESPKVPHFFLWHRIPLDDGGHLTGAEETSDSLESLATTHGHQISLAIFLT